MSTFNGIGTKFLGLSEPDTDGICQATNWITFFYIPVLPLSRSRIRMISSEHRGLMHTLKYEIISKESLSFKEILTTYLFGWILIPLLLIAPLMLCISEIADALGLPQSEFKGLLNGFNFGVREYLLIGALIWLLVAVVKLKKWDEKRGFPEKV